MKVTELRIAPLYSWKAAGPDNPLRAVVKLNSKDSTVECVLSESAMYRMLDLCAEEIAENAKRQVDEFAQAVTAITGDKSHKLIEG